MKFLADENFPLASVKYLKANGVDIESVSIISPGISDLAVNEMATKSERCILTFDRDFGELIFKNTFPAPAGIVLFRLTGFEPEQPGRMIMELLNQEEIALLNNMTVISEKTIRQKKI